jgi:hypothetical protein
MPRGADKGDFVVDVIDSYNAAAATLTLDVDIQTKNSETADGAVGGPLATVTLIAGAVVPGTYGTSFEGALELVRFRIKVGGDAENEWVHMRMQTISWAPN